MKRHRPQEVDRPNKKERIDKAVDELQFPITQLPCELLQYIFGYLDFSHLARAQGVCVEWNNLLLDDYVWKSLYLKRFGGPLPAADYQASCDAQASCPNAKKTITWREHAVFTYKSWLKWSASGRSVEVLTWALSHKHIGVALEEIQKLPPDAVNERISLGTWDDHAKFMWNSVFSDSSFAPHTLLDIASGFGLSDAVHALLQRGAHPDGIAHKNKDITVQRVLGRGGPIGLATPLLLAAKAGHLDVVNVLLSHGARKGDEDWKSFAALHQILRAMYPSADRQPYAIMLAWRHGFMNRSALAAALTARHVSVVRALLQAGSDITFMDEQLNGLLHMAAKAGDREMISILLHHIKESSTLSWDLVNMVNENQATPLDIATKQGHTAVVQALLEYGADIVPNQPRGGKYRTAFQVAIERKLWDIAALFLKHGANPNEKLTGRTPMQLAITVAGNEAIDFVGRLLEAGATIQPNVELCAAVRYRKGGENADKMAAFLISRGCDVSALDVMTIPQLKVELKRRRLGIRGKKPVLLERLVQHLIATGNEAAMEDEEMDDRKSEQKEEVDDAGEEEEEEGGTGGEGYTEAEMALDNRESGEVDDEHD